MYRMIQYFLLATHRIQETSSLPKKNSWVHVSDPSEKELELLAKQFHLELGHLKDALDENEVPRFEEEDNCAYLYTRVPVTKDMQYSTVPILFILHPHAVFTVSKTSLSLFDKFLEGKDIQRATPMRLFISFFNEIVNQYNSAIAKINKQTVSTTIDIDSITNRDIVALVLYEQILNEFLNAVVQTNTFLKVFMTNKRFVKEEADQDLIEDLFLATGQLIELSKSSLHQVKNLREAYSTIMTNNLNRVIKFFTALTIVFTIPMIIASLYGMNVQLPLGDHPFAFFGIVLFICCLSFGAIYIFFKRRWL